MEVCSLTKPWFLHSVVRTLLNVMDSLSTLLIQRNAAMGMRMDFMTLGRNSIICRLGPKAMFFCLKSLLFGVIEGFGAAVTTVSSFLIVPV